MRDGFLGFQATFMLDLVVCALVLVVPVLCYSLWAVRKRREFGRHRQLQLILGGSLLAAVLAFEVDLQLVHGGWENVVAKRQPPLSEDALERTRVVLWIHLAFAVSTPIAWAATIVLASRRFPTPPVPSSHSRMHRILGWVAAIDLTLTSVTGLAFYYSAFIA